MLSSGDIPITLSKENSAQIKRTVRDFRNSYSDDDYSVVYDFKEDAESTVLDILNSTILENKQTLMEESGQAFSLNMSPSKNSGIVSYYTDGFEDVTADNVTAEMFQMDKYQRKSLRTTNIIDQGIPVYKLITSNEWQMVLPLTKDQFDKLSEKEQVKFTILENDFQTSAALKLTQKDSNYYAVLTMYKYLSDYLEDRYLDVELDFDTVEGLKIPLTSMIEKDFYTVPLEYLSMGADSTDTGLIIETYDKKTGDASYTFTPTNIYYEDETNAYIDAEQFPAGTYIHSSTDTERYTLGPTSKLTGVYNVNQGYAVFCRVEILYQNDEYCIVKDNSTYGLSAYDQIALDGATAVDQAIIY